MCGIGLLEQLLKVDDVSLESFILPNKLGKLVDWALDTSKSIYLLLDKAGNTIEDLEPLLSVGRLLGHELLLFEITDGSDHGGLVSASPGDSILFLFEIVL